MNRIKKYQWHIAAFLLPFLTSLGICMGTGVYPFGENCILHVDMYHQYCPFFTEFLHKLQNGGSLMYSWNLGLGSDFTALFAYYLASPLNWILILCPQGLVIEFMTLLILIKIGICGWSFFLFLKEHYGMIGRDGKFHANTVFPALVFSMAYALSGFVATYSWNIMWMDCIALAPLIILGLEKLVKENKTALYYITLSISILSNYYISIMICIFLALYFLFLFFEQKKGRFRALLRFSVYSLLAGGTGAVLLLPEMLILGYSGSAGIQFPEKAEWYFSLLAELSRTCMTASPYTGREHWPNLYAGVFCILLFVLYLFNSRIGWKKKISGALMIGFFLLSFANNYLDFIWHGFHFPDSLPGRQSFLFAFVLLAMGFETVRKWKGTKLWHIGIAFAAAEIMLIASAAVTDAEITDALAFLVSGVFAASYAALMVMIKLSNKKTGSFLGRFAFVLAVGELVINMAVTGFYTTSRTLYREKMEDYAGLLELTEGGDSFYRVEDPQRKTKNDDSLYGYPSATIFSSLMNIHVSDFYRSVLMEGGKNFYCYNGATPLTSAMLSVKYILSDSAQEEGPLRSLIGMEGGQYLYENRYCLPLGYVMSEEAIEEWDNSGASKIGNLNSLARALGATEDMLIPSGHEEQVSAGSTTIELPQEGYYYALYDSCSSDSLTETFLSGKTKKFSKTTHRYLLDLGYDTPEDVITISNTNGEMISFSVYRLNLTAVEQAYQTLCGQTMELLAFEDTLIEGKITVNEAGRLILSIPSEAGWTLYVDGKETEITDFKDTFISTHLEEGTHTIRLEYETPGLKTGALVSASSLGIFLLLLLVRRKRDGKEVD